VPGADSDLQVLSEQQTQQNKSKRMLSTLPTQREQPKKERRGRLRISEKTNRGGTLGLATENRPYTFDSINRGNGHGNPR